LRKKNLLQKIRNNGLPPAALQGRGDGPASGGGASRLTSFLLLFLLIWSIVVALPQPAHAVLPPPPYLIDNVTLYTCPGPNCGSVINNLSADGGAVCPNTTYGLVTRLVICIQENVLYAVQTNLAAFMGYIWASICALITLAIALWGLAMATGRKGAPTRELAVLIMKIGIISVLMGGSAFNFPSIFQSLLDGMGEMLGMVVNYSHYSNLMYCPKLPSYGVTPNYYYAWMQVDCMLNTLLGFVYSGGTLAIGFIGFLIACFLSGSVGFFIGTIGLIMILQIVITICRAVYVYLAAIIGLAAVAMVAPIFIPLILFKSTKPYFDKWLKNVIGFILQPIFLFIFLTMMLSAFDEIMFDTSNQYSLYSVIAISNTPGLGPDLQAHWGHIDQGTLTGYAPGTWEGFIGGRLLYAQQTYGPSPPPPPPVLPPPPCTSAYCLISNDNTGLVYHQVTLGSGGVNIDPAQAMKTITRDLNVPTDTGDMAAGTIHQYYMPDPDPAALPGSQTLLQNDITNTQMSFAGIGGQMNKVNGIVASKTVTGINWYGLACLNSSTSNNWAYSSTQPAKNPPADPHDGGACLSALSDGTHTLARDTDLTLYLIQLFMSLLMALVTAYIFTTMLGYLPFIGQGLIDINMPILGSGATSMPGGNMFEGFKGMSLPK